MSNWTTIEQSFGLEQISREAFIVLFENLNDELDAQQAKWNNRDQSLAQIRGVTYTPVVLEHVAPEHFYLGNEPSLINDQTPIESYPAFCVMAYNAAPDLGEDDLDQASVYTDNVYIEGCVKASPEEGSEICDRRAWRTADAINNCIQRNRTLNGEIADLGTSPTCIISEIFTRPRGSDYGEDWLWQALRIDYNLNRTSPFQW